MGAVRGPSLVVLAAGLGSRFGGPKQLEPVDEAGATLLDYSLHDAWRAGFGRAVLVVRPDHRDRFEGTIVPRHESRFPVAVVTQRIDDLPIEIPFRDRLKPWGTAQAVWAAREHLGGGFGVANADDRYGRAALAQVARWLGDHAREPDRHVVVGFPLAATVSDAGGVNRAVLETTPDGRLARIEEVHGLVRGAGGFIGRSPTGERTTSGDALVSMNLWGFGSAMLAALERGFREFLERRPADGSEYLLPQAVEESIGRGALVEVVAGEGRWVGLTHREDLGPVRVALAALVRAGEYPSRLW